MPETALPARRARDEPPSWPATGPDEAAGPRVSVIVPTLDEERALPRLLDHLAGLEGRFEVIVVDGGSSDATLAVARAHPLGPTLVAAPRGRARQLNAAAATAEGDLLVFLHADSLLPLDAYASLTAAWRDPALAGGNFTLRFEGSDLFARILTTTYAVQRRLGYFYGDSSIFARRETFEALGGFRELAVMDDYDFARRLGRHGRLACLGGPATTSSRRWRRLGVLRTVLSWVVIRWLFVLRVPPERLARLYRRAR
ncbi:TIGR04283 family arsenosugar biosynthesis glycosyltransferase [soil metagenome]